MASGIPLLALVFLFALWPEPAATQDVNRAALVIRKADDSVVQSCVSFSESSISGRQLLERASLDAGLDVIFDNDFGMGGAICSIDGQGCYYPDEDCFCMCTGEDCEYWAYYHWRDDHWEYSSTGAGNYQVTSGALEGWSWGPGTFGTSGVPPPATSFDEICGQVEGGQSQRTSQDRGGNNAPELDRDFNPRLLFGYATFALVAALLLAFGVIIARRRSG